MRRSNITFGFIAAVVAVIIFFGVPAMAQDLTGTWAGSCAVRCFDSVDGTTQATGKNDIIYIEDHGDGTISVGRGKTGADPPSSIVPWFFGKVIQVPEDGSSGAVALIGCSTDIDLPYNSSMAEGRFTIGGNKESLELNEIRYQGPSYPDYQSLCNFRWRYTRVNTILYDVPACGEGPTPQP